MGAVVVGGVVVGGVVVGGGEGALVVGAAPVVGTDSGVASPSLSFPAQASDPTKINGTTDIVIAVRNPDCTMPLTALLLRAILMVSLPRGPVLAHSERQPPEQ